MEFVLLALLPLRFLMWTLKGVVFKNRQFSALKTEEAATTTRTFLAHLQVYSLCGSLDVEIFLPSLEICCSNQ